MLVGMTSRLAQAAAAMVAVIIVSLVAIVWAATQSSSAATRTQAGAGQTVVGPAGAATGAGAAAPSTHPQVVEPAAGVAPTPNTSLATATSTLADVPDPTTITPSLAQPVSDAVVRQELRDSGMTANPAQATLTPTGLALAPIGAPLAVAQVIAAGNEIARLPYVWGGGHGTYADTGYDCSGSISYVFAAAHLIDTTMVSGELASWGEPGPGKWITVFANAGHTFMYVAGLRFDTVALAETGTRWSNRPADESDLASFAIRHPPGL